jgi:hypothetical protein
MSTHPQPQGLATEGRRPGAWRRRLAVFLLAAAACAASTAIGIEYIPLLRPAPVPGLSDLRPGPAGPPFVRRIVVLIFDGARRDALLAAAQANPQTRALLDRGALFRGKSGHPSLSRPMYATLGSGATPALTGVASNSHQGLLRVDSVIVRARRTGLEVILRDDLTTHWWDLFASLPAERAPSLEAALARVRHGGRLLAYLHVLEPDDVAHKHGAASEEYRAAMQTAAEKIAQVAGTLDLDRDLLVVTADHGHRDRGGHGGQEPEVLNVPLWLFGRGVRAGQYGEAYLRDVAPTVAVLAGLAFPSQSQGRPLLEALALPPDVATSAVDRWLAEEWRLATAVLTALGAPPKPPLSSPRGEHAWEASQVMARDYEEAIAIVLGERERRDRWIRAAWASPLLLGAIFVFWLRRPRLLALGAALCSAGFYFAVCAALFPFSLSAVRQQGEFYVHLGLVAVLSQNLVAWPVVWAARRRADATVAIDAGIFTVVFASLEVAAMFVWTGLGAGNGLPSPAGYMVPEMALARFAIAVSLWGCVIAPLFPWLMGRKDRQKGAATHHAPRS